MAAITMRSRVVAKPKADRLKQLFWVYFILWIFEGALRKWILPQLSGPLLLVRDPVALLIIMEAFSSHRIPARFSSLMAALTLVFTFLFAIQLGSGLVTPAVGLYGLRSYLLPFPIAFIMGDNLNEKDLRSFAKWTLILLIPITLLAIAQYLAPGSSVLNKGATVGQGQLDYTGDHVRASSAFSYVTGTSAYVPLAAAFLCYAMVRKKYVKSWIIVASGAAVVLIVPLVGSRGAIFSVGLILIFVIAASFLGVSNVVRVARIAVGLFIVTGLATLLPVFNQAMDSMSQRIANTSGDQGQAKGLQDRLVLALVKPIQDELDSGDYLGQGMGVGSNFAAVYQTGNAGFQAGEGEVGREVVELGLLVGVGFLLTKVGLVFWLCVKSFKSLKSDLPLAWFMLSGTVTTLVVGLLEQPTSQGSVVLYLAFIIAATNVKSKSENQFSRAAIRTGIRTGTAIQVRSRG